MRAFGRLDRRLTGCGRRKSLVRSRRGHRSASPGGRPGGRASGLPGGGERLRAADNRSDEKYPFSSQKLSG
ncbi:MAG: hypothetical protein ACK55Z_14295 [bacterium]